MKKRTFLKLSSALMAGTAFAPLAGCSSDKRVEKLTNWAGNLTYSTSRIFAPRTLEEIYGIVTRQKNLRVLGTRHCFNDIADSPYNLLSTGVLNQVITLDTDARTVTVEAGIRYGELCQYLDGRGFAIHNLASLPHISVAGACATATHGSGSKNGNLATSVSAVDIMTASGEIVSLSREKDPDIFPGVVVNLGALGVVIRITLDIVPAFSIRQNVYLNLPVDQLQDHFDEIMSSGYSVSLFTDWQSPNINQVWIKRLAAKDEPVKSAPEFFGALAAPRNVHPILEVSPENCTEQMGVPGPWYERLPHFKMGFTPSSGEELQAEYFVPRQYGYPAIKAIETLRDQLGPVLFISEIRTIDGDDLWMSPCYQQPSVAIHFTLKQDKERVNALLPQIEEKLAPFHARPHWGKLFALSPAALHVRYEKFDKFRELMNRYDPEGKFRNAFIKRNLSDDTA